jgi:hypothetical protein
VEELEHDIGDGIGDGMGDGVGVGGMGSNGGEPGVVANAVTNEHARNGIAHAHVIVYTQDFFSMMATGINGIIANANITRMVMQAIRRP